MLADYRFTSLSVGAHPDRAAARAPAVPGALERRALGRGEREQVLVAGLVVARQRPSTANGIVFMLLEDEHGQVNLIVPPPVYDRFRAIVRGEQLVLARGRFEVNGRNRNVVVDELTSLAPLARQAADDADVRSALPPRPQLRTPVTGAGGRPRADRGGRAFASLTRARAPGRGIGVRPPS